MIVNWTYEYYLNEDLCLVDFKNFHEKEHEVFPTLSICFRDPFLEHQLTENYGVNASTYLKFLEGNYFHSDMLRIDYEDVTLELSDYMLRYYVKYFNGSYDLFYTTPDLIKHIPNQEKAWHETRRVQFMYNSYNGWYNVGSDAFVKCFALPMPHQRNANYMAVEFRTAVFPNGTRPPSDALLSIIHNPTQLLWSIPTIKYNWPTRKDNSSFEMKFVIDGVEVLRRRNKQNQPCNEQWLEYDDQRIVAHAKDIGCHAPYQNLSLYPSFRNMATNTSVCKTKESMEKAKLPLALGIADNHISPCMGMQRVYYTYQEFEWADTYWDNPGYFWCGFSLRDTHYKEITQSRYTYYLSTSQMVLEERVHCLANFYYLSDMAMQLSP